MLGGRIAVVRTKDMPYGSGSDSRLRDGVGSFGGSRARDGLTARGVRRGRSAPRGFARDPVPRSVTRGRLAPADPGETTYPFAGPICSATPAADSPTNGRPEPAATCAPTA